MLIKSVAFHIIFPLNFLSLQMATVGVTIARSGTSMLMLERKICIYKE